MVRVEAAFRVHRGSSIRNSRQPIISTCGLNYKVSGKPLEYP
jgi:hypothetical protein